MALDETPGAIGNRVREARLRKGWSQVDLAYRAGMTHQNVSLIERGQRPKDRAMAALASALEVDRAWLFFVVPTDQPRPSIRPSRRGNRFAAGHGKAAG